MRNEGGESKVMIVSYYGQCFFGGGTYFKLSKKDNEDIYKFECCHIAVPNYIPKAEEYIKKYDTLKVYDGRFKDYFEGKISEKYLDMNPYIEKLLTIINNSDWTTIIKNTYTSEELDDVCWIFYVEDENKKEIYKKGYSVFPKEIETILTIFKNMKDDYVGELPLNKKDLEFILSLRNKKD